MHVLTWKMYTHVIPNYSWVVAVYILETSQSSLLFHIYKKNFWWSYTYSQISVYDISDRRISCVNFNFHPKHAKSIDQILIA